MGTECEILSPAESLPLSGVKHRAAERFPPDQAVLSQLQTWLPAPQSQKLAVLPHAAAALLNTWQAGSSEGKSGSITCSFKTPKPFGAQCCTL